MREILTRNLMKRLLLAALIALSCGSAAAQKITRAQFADARPEESFKRWFNENFGTIDQPLLVRFTIDKKGAMGEVHNVGQSDSELFARVEQALKASPKWRPARKRKKHVATDYYLVRRRDSDSLKVVYNDDAEYIHARFGEGRKGDEYGILEFRSWVMRRVVYPELAVKLRIEGKVTVKFVVECDGGVKVAEIMSSPNVLLTNEAARVIYLSPNWTPGTIEGFPVRVFYALPVNFEFPKQEPNSNGHAGI